MSCSNALLPPEILRNVFEPLDSAALARSARVCRLWCDVAVDILWSDLPTLFPLLELYGLRFSETQWYGNTRQDYWDFGPDGPDVLGERHRQMYLPRIRSLRHNSAKTDVIKMQTLTKMSSVGLHLPNLKRLYFIGGGNSEDDFLGAIPFILPTIKSLKLPTISMISYNDLPTLRHLIQSICNTPGLSLESLDVGGTIILYPGLIEAVGSLVRQQTSLRHLGITLSDIELLPSACSKNGEYPTLTSLMIYYLPMPPHLNLDFVHPLFRFRSLKALELDTLYTSIGIQEQDVISMASAWPGLQQLRLGPFYCTPELLVSIARAFPFSDTLSALLRCKDAVWPQLADSMPHFRHLDILHLRPDPGRGRSNPPLETSEAATLAQLIIAICPNEPELILHFDTKTEDVRRCCTSVDVIEAAILEVFRERTSRSWTRGAEWTPE